MWQIHTAKPIARPGCSAPDLDAKQQQRNERLCLYVASRVCGGGRRGTTAAGRGTGAGQGRTASRADEAAVGSGDPASIYLADRFRQDPPRSTPVRT